jgi:CxxC-x17-CxxC domain-containing protein
MTVFANEGVHAMSYTDKNLSCRDCGASFVFTAGEQEFHDQKGFTNTPGRCPDCRAKRKSEGGFGGGGSRGPREMHSATCASCGKSCQVPFLPNGEKPVYCSECFQGRGGGGGRY